MCLRCVAEGGRPAPEVYWYLGDTRLDTDTDARITRALVTGSEVSASVRLLAARPLLQASVKCKVANQAMNNSAMTASVTLDINLRPLATRSAATHYYLT